MIREMEISAWNGKDLEAMTLDEMTKALKQAATMISILSGEVAGEMQVCKCAFCRDSASAAYVESLGRPN